MLVDFSQKKLWLLYLVNTQKQQKLPRFRVKTFRLCTEIQKSPSAIGDHRKPNTNILRTAFTLAFYYFIFQMQMKPRIREHAIMTNYFDFQLGFALAFREREASEDVSRLGLRRLRVFCSCWVTLCLRKPFPHPYIQRTCFWATKVIVEEQCHRLCCGAVRWQYLLDTGRKTFPTTVPSQGSQLRFWSRFYQLVPPMDIYGYIYIAPDESSYSAWQSRVFFTYVDHRRHLIT